MGLDPLSINREQKTTPSKTSSSTNSKKVKVLNSQSNEIVSKVDSQYNSEKKKLIKEDSSYSLDNKVSLLPKSTPHELLLLAEAKRKKEKEESLTNFFGNAMEKSNYLVNFDTIEGQEFLMEAVKETISDEEGTMFLGVFLACNRVKSKDTLFKIIRLFVKEDLGSVYQIIDNCNIDFSTKKGKKVFHEIVDATLKDRPESLKNLFQNFSLFALKSEEIQAEVALKVAEKNISALCDNIHLLKIDFNTEKGKETFQDIAKIAFQTGNIGAMALSRNMHKFNIKSEEVRMEMARNFARINICAVCQDVQNYGIDPTKESWQSLLIEFAEKAAKNSSTSASFLSNNIHKFQIASENSRIEIAKIAAKTNGSTVLNHLPNWQIKNKEALFNIVKIAASNNGANTIWHLLNNLKGFFTYEEEISIIEIAFKQDVVAASPYFGSIPPQLTKVFKQASLDQLSAFTLEKFVNFFNTISKYENFSKEFELINLFYKNMDLNTISNHFQEICKKNLDLPENILTWINQSYTSIPKDFNKRRFLEWATVFIILSKDKRSLIMQNTQLLESIRKTPPWLRDLLSKDLLTFYENFDEKKSSALQAFHEQCKTVKNDKGEIIKTLTHPPVHTELPSLIFASYPSETHEACFKAMEKIKNEREFFREKSHMKNLLETLIRINKAPLAPHEKKCLVEKLFDLDKQEILIACTLIKNLISFNNLSFFQGLEEKGSDNLVKDLEDNLAHFFQKTFQSTTSDFGKKYANTFEKWRSIEMLVTYASKLNNLLQPDKDIALKLLERFVTEVLNDEFQTKRYETENNPHLSFIKNSSPEIFEKWKENISLDSTELITYDKEEDKEKNKLQQVKNLLVDGILQNHLGEKGIYSNLEKYLADLPNRESITSYIEEINNQLQTIVVKQKSINSKEISKEELQKTGKTKKILAIEKNILDLFSIIDSGNMDEVNKKLKLLIKQLPKDHQYRKINLEASLKIIDDKTPKVADFQVVESDHPNDFILMGTEVLGSCQHILADPEYNKCLLGYALDGKIKEYCLIDAQGKIHARAVERLLIDANNKPVLFMEGIYTSNSNPIYAPNLRKLALKKAKLLGVPLVTKSYSQGENIRAFSSPVFALKKPLLFEYVDALRGIVPDPYTIENTVEITH